MQIASLGALVGIAQVLSARAWLVKGREIKEGAELFSWLG